jgi:molybdopterin-guanine dinucleotide biosynthesis protein A
MYKLEPSNVLRFGLLDHLAQGAKPDEKDIVQAWCNQQWEYLTVTLQKPVVEDVPILIAAANSKGVEFIRDK